MLSPLSKQVSKPYSHTGRLVSRLSPITAVLDMKDPYTRNGPYQNGQEPRGESDGDADVREAVERPIVLGEHRNDQQVLEEPDSHVDAQSDDDHHHDRALHERENERREWEEEAARHHGPEIGPIVSVHLPPQRLGLVGEIAEPGNEKLRPEEIKPHQSESGDDHAEVLDMIEAEMRARTPSQ